MKISFDLDGTAWKYRKEFSALAHILKNSGHQVGILTAHASNLKKADLRLWEARGFPAPDFYICKEGVFENMPTPNFKANAIELEQIDIHFEDFDDGKYAEQFDLALLTLFGHHEVKVVRIK